MSIVGTSWTVVVTDKRSRKLSQSMDDFDGSINGHSYTVLNFILSSVSSQRFNLDLYNQKHKIITYTEFSYTELLNVYELHNDRPLHCVWLMVY